jgi:hypothetical protein
VPVANSDRVLPGVQMAKAVAESAPTEAAQGEHAGELRVIVAPAPASAGGSYES